MDGLGEDGIVRFVSVREEDEFSELSGVAVLVLDGFLVTNVLPLKSCQYFIAALRRRSKIVTNLIRVISNRPSNVPLILVLIYHHAYKCVSIVLFGKCNEDKRVNSTSP